MAWQLCGERGAGGVRARASISCARGRGGARVGVDGGNVKGGRLGNWVVTLGLNRTAMLTYERNILISPQKREKNTPKGGLTEKIILRQRGGQAFRPTARKLCLALGMFA